MIIRYIPRSMAAIWALVSVLACERELDGPDHASVNSGGSHAYIVAPTGTRTDFDSYVGKFAWSEGDKIAIHLSDGTFYSTRVNAETGAFTCSTTPSKQRDAYAVYPTSAVDATNYGAPTLKVVLPAEYDISNDLASDFSPVPMIAVNRQGEDDLYFRHVGGLLRITCDRVPEGTRYIAVTFDRNVAGTFTVANPASDHPTISEGGDTPTVVFRIARWSLLQRSDGFILNVPVPVGPINAVRVAALGETGTELRSTERDVALMISRGYGKKLACNAIPAYYDSMQMIISASEGKGMTFRLPFNKTVTLPADLTVDWGDGSMTEFKWGDVLSSDPDVLYHTYASEGDYTITLTGRADNPAGPFIPQFTFYYNGTITPAHRMLKSMPTPMLHMTDEGGGSQFYGCSNLESVCGDLFSKNPQSSFAYTFYGCTSLHEIPEELFSYVPDAGSFNYTFSGAGLTCRIPEKLFANNPRARSFRSTFAGCGLTGSIPEQLFANNPLVTRFDETFWGCQQLTGPIPGDLFANCPEVTTFSNAFRYCVNLSGPIPAGLFASCTKATDFERTFDTCQSLSGTVPGALFANQPDITSFNRTFIYCTGLTGVDADLFACQLHAKSFSSTFYGCTGITGLPAGLFRNNAEATDFGSTFCHSGLQSIPAGLFSHNPEVTTFENTFSWCIRLQTPLPGDLFAGCRKVTSFQGTFQSCKMLRDPIPESLFADCTEVTTFRQVFNDCLTISGPIPAGLFAHNAKVTTFQQAFCGDYALSASLPAGLFVQNPLVESFEECFGGCEVLSGELPAGFFANNPVATNFISVFAGCNRLSISPDVFTSATVTPSTRFASVESAVDFTACFNSIGTKLDNAGTAPALWGFTFPEGLPPVKTRCFGGSTHLSNYTDIPSEWK